VKIVTMIAAVATMTAVAAPAYALQDCTAGKEDKRICNVDYSPNNVLRVWGTLRSMTLFQFGPGETNPRIAAADMNVLTFIPDGNIAILKPKPVPAPAWHIQPIVMLTTLADGKTVRAYQIEYDLLDQGPITADSEVTQFAIHYHYPGDVARAQAAAWRASQAAFAEQQVKAKLATTGPGSASGGPGTTCDYVEQHDPEHPVAFVPTRVCDDGQATYLTFPGNMPVPAITIDGPDGKPIIPMQNFDTTGSYQVIHQVAHHFYLRIGDALDCIWKTGPINPAGYNPGTNTSSPNVVRVLKDAAP
jgi:type IV secretion system protein VirB9